MDKIILKVQYTGISLSLFAWIIGIIGSHVELLQVEINLDLFIFVYLTLVLIIYIISFTALKSPEIFKVDENQIKIVFFNNKHNKPSGNGKPTISKSLAQTQDKNYQIEETDDKLLDYIEKEKPYLNPELSLQELADLVGEKRYFLSIVINQKHNKNFFEFINSYRVEEVKAIIANPENKNLKLIAIALDAGFNSKASFNRIFKQMTNMSPSQYISAKQAV